MSGTVTDGSTGETLPGANVSVVGTQTGTTTDAQGQYELEVPGPGVSLEFSFIGYETKQVEVGDQEVIDVTLQEAVGQLEEVVVTGYGTQQRREITGSVSSVDVAEAVQGNNSSAQDLIQGRLAGVNVVSNSGEPGAGMRIRVRGDQSISAGNDPLYVIDGVPISNTNMTPGGTEAGGVTSSNDTNPLAMLNPQDIESIDVLKDASATAIYGSQGSNGVVLIETKSGSGGDFRVNYGAKLSAGVLSKKLDLLSGDEYRSAVNDLAGTPVSEQPSASTDWQEESMRSTFSQEHNLSFSGGTEQTSYRASVGYSTQQGLLLDSGFDRVNARINADHSTLDDRLRFNLNLTATQMDRNHAFFNQGGGFQTGAIKAAIVFDPRRPVRNEDGTFNEYARSVRNPVGLLKQITDETEQQRILGNLSAEADLLENLTLKGTFGTDLSNGIRRTYLPKANAVGAEFNGLASQTEQRLTNLVGQSTLRYNKALLDGAHNLKLLGGFEFKEETFNLVGVEARDFIADAVTFNNLASATEEQPPFSDKQKVTQVSFFARANYNIEDKYLLEATVRRDGSSVFGEDNKFAFFPSASVGWNIAEESFLDVEGLTQLKLRLSGGISGNQGVPPYQSLALLQPSSGDAGIFGSGETEVTGVTQVRSASPGLKWEETREVNAAVDVTAGPIDGSVEAYYRRTDDLLFNTRTQPPAPSEFVLDNVGAVKNQGVEVSLDGYVIDQEDIGLTVGANASSNYNEILDLGGRGTIDHGPASGQGLTDVQSQRLAPGHPIGSFYGAKFLRINDAGEEVYEAEDGETTDVNAAKEQFLGNVVPDVSYGLNLRFRYKGFNANAFFRGEQGREVFNNTAAELTTKSLIGRTNVMSEALEDGTAQGHAPSFSSRWVEDASFFRMDKLTLGYNFQNASQLSLRRARIYVSAQNLFVITPYDGFDPELNTNVSGEGIGFRSLSTPARGIDYTSYPRSRTFTLGVEVGL